MHLTALKGDTADLLFYQSIAPEIIEAYELKPGREIMPLIDSFGEDRVYECIQKSMKAHFLHVGIETESHHPRLVRETEASRFFLEGSKPKPLSELTETFNSCGAAVSSVRGGFMVSFPDGSLAKLDNDGYFQSCNRYSLLKPDDFVRLIGTLDRNLERLNQATEMSMC